MKKITVTVGIGKDMNNVEMPQAEVSQGHTLAKNVATAAFGGVTSTSGAGSWVHEGQIITEPVIVYSSLSETATPDDARLFAQQVKSIFRQTAVVLEFADVQADFV